MLLEQVFKVFGSTLPDKDTFFATTENPMVLLDLRREGWKTWENFVNDYYSYVKSKTVTMKVVEQGSPKAVTK